MQVSKCVVIRNRLGLHARAAAQLVQLADRFRSEIKLKKISKEEEIVVNGKSIMGVMMLGLTKGSKLEVIAEGQDAEEALCSLVHLINNGFGEGE
jgi:phosphocarrier protein